MRGPRRLRDLLGDWKPHKDSGRATTDLASSAFALAWDQAVGAQVARRSRPTKFHNGVLTVLTASSAWSDQLSLLAPNIIASLQKAYPQGGLRKLRFLVASGRTKLLLDAERHRAHGVSRQQPGVGIQRQEQGQTPDAPDEDLHSAIQRLASEQHTLDNLRDRSGWRVCSVCRRRFLPGATQAQQCAPCVDTLRRKMQGKIERALMQAPWLSLGALCEFLPGISATAYERTRQRLLARWQFELTAAERRLRRGSPSAEDRVVAWSFVMLQSGLAQHDIGRAVVTDILGTHWTAVLFDNVATPKLEAVRPRREKTR